MHQICSSKSVIAMFIVSRNYILLGHFKHFFGQFFFSANFYVGVPNVLTVSQRTWKVMLFA